MSIVSDTLLLFLPSKRKTTPSGWVSFDAPCCIHNGETKDERQRGGLIQEGDTVSYHCFNCGYKASWQPGRNLSYKMRQIMIWLGVPDNIINKLALDVLRLNEGVEVATRNIDLPEFASVPLPEDSVLIQDDPCDVSEQLTQVKDYMASRKLWLDEGYEYFWTPKLGYRDRLIIPFKYEGRIVGWTARTVKESKAKYISESQPGFVFGLDEQRPQKIYCVVVEGPIDAIHIEGCALLGSEINDQQALLLNRLNKEVVVLPDRDKAGKKLVEEAIDRGWSVSMPEWKTGIKDVGDAVLEYGKIYTLYSIISAAESSPLKIRLRAKRWFDA
jgi:hypothetical protein